MKKLAILAAIVALAIPTLFAPAAFAESPGQLAGGADIFQVRNVTKDTNYGSSASVVCGDTVKFSVKLSNTEYGLLSDVTVKASLTSGDATVTAKNAEGTTVSTSGKVAVTVEKGSLNYISGSTQLYTVDGQLIKGLSDGITSNGVNIGNLNGSTRQFVQFQANLDCPTTPPVTPPTTTTPPELPRTGTTENVVALAGLGAIVAAVSYFVASRRTLNRR